VAAYQFEQDWHSEFRKKGYLSKEEIGGMFARHMQDYMGDFVDQSPGSENWWVHWPHFRTYFYVYSYASGLLISKSMQAAVKKDPKFISKVKEFLQAGTSDSPKNIFLKMGIDVADEKFWDLGLEEINKLLSDTDSLAKKLKKI
jgi:oligoendopeptidase F